MSSQSSHSAAAMARMPRQKMRSMASEPCPGWERKSQTGAGKDQRWPMGGVSYGPPPGNTTIAGSC